MERSVLGKYPVLLVVTKHMHTSNFKNIHLQKSVQSMSRCVPTCHQRKSSFHLHETSFHLHDLACHNHDFHYHHHEWNYHHHKTTCHHHDLGCHHHETACHNHDFYCHKRDLGIHHHEIRFHLHERDFSQNEINFQCCHSRFSNKELIFYNLSIKLGDKEDLKQQMTTNDLLPNCLKTKKPMLIAQALCILNTIYQIPV